MNEIEAITGHMVSSHEFSKDDAALAVATYLKVFPQYGDGRIDADLVAEDVASWFGSPDSFRAQNVYGQEEWKKKFMKK